MSWVDILKEAITQSRVKEIEDIDIDIDDDDCLRWLNRLYDIIAREPSVYRFYDDIIDEETACKVKETWEDKGGLEFFEYEFNRHKKRRGRIRNREHKITVSLEVELDKIDNTFEVELYLSNRQNRKSKWYVAESLSKEKAIRKTKELCNYLNVSYDELTEGIF